MGALAFMKKITLLLGGLCGVAGLARKPSLVQATGKAYTKRMREPDPPQDARRKRLKFRAWHRGMKEVDLILGPFADAHVDGLDEAALDQFEQLLSVPDNELYDWLCDRRTPPDSHRTRLYEQVRDFSRRTRRV
jgi:antitoxin CptB